MKDANCARMMELAMIVWMAIIWIALIISAPDVTIHAQHAKMALIVVTLVPLAILMLVQRSVINVIGIVSHASMIQQIAHHVMMDFI